MSLLGKDTFFTGSFSMAGRDSAEKYNISAEAKKVEEKEKNNRVFKSFFARDEEWEKKHKHNDNDNENIARECNLNIDEIKKNYKYTLEYIKKKNDDNQILEKSTNLKNKSKKNEKKTENKIFKKIFQSFKYKYHNIHLSKLEKYKKSGLMNKMNIQQEPIYNPKLNYIYQKISIGPPWSKLSGRGPHLFNEENYINNFSYNDSNNSLPDKIKGFIDMSKQTQRNGFPINGDIRQRCEKKFIPLNYKVINNKKDYLFYKTSTSNPSFKMSSILYNNKSNNIPEIKLPFSESNTSRNKIKYHSINEKSTSDKLKYINRSCSVPDFNSYLSRDKLNKLFKKKDRITNEVLFPNYKSIEANVKMMVVYSKESNSLKKNIKKKEFKGISSDEVYNANEVFEKIYGNKIRAVPIFKKMTARPEDNNLPFFLNGLTNRMCCNCSNGKSLKMNSYSNSQLYNLCRELNTRRNRYKNELLTAIRNSLGFNNQKNYDKKRIKIELKLKSKKFKDLIINNNL